MRFFSRRHRHLTLLRTHARKNNRIKESITTRTRGLTRAARRNRILLVALLAVGGIVALLTGISLAQGNWFPSFIFAQNPPKGRFGAAATLDEARSEILIFGGFVTAGVPVPPPPNTVPETITLPESPAGEISGAPEEVDVPKNLVREVPLPINIAADRKTWIFKDGKWLNRDTVHSPSARGYAAIAYDGARRNVVLFGGAPYNSNNVFGDTWVWNGEDWTEQSPPEPVPDPRQNAAMVYDPHRKVVVMFGGRGANGVAMNDTWVWNGSAWKIMPRAVGDPSPRHSHAMAYDVCRAEAVMFGGVGPATDNTVHQPFETWTWDGAKWTPQSPKLSPPPRIGASMAYSPRTGNVLLYGGLMTNEAGVATVAADDDVWRWAPDAPIPNGSTGWERMHSDVTTAVDNVVNAGLLLLGDLRPRAQPPPRAFATFVLTDPSRSDNASGFLLFGGTPFAGAGGVQVAYSDMFGFEDKGYYTSLATALVGSDETLFGQPDTPLTRRCINPVPIPPDAEIGEAVGVPEGPKFQVREGMREIDQLPVLIGTDWPYASRSTHTGSGQTAKPNPSYTPPPDCPNRSPGGATSGNSEDGSQTYLYPDPKRNQVYQFFVCDFERGWRGSSQTRNSDVHRLLIAAYDGSTLELLGRVVIPSPQLSYLGLTPELIDDVDRGRFLLKSSTGKLVVIQKDLIEKSADPRVGEIDSTPGFTHPRSGRAKSFFYVAAGGPTAGPPPAQSTPPKLGQRDFETGSQDWLVELTGCSGGSGPSFAMHTGSAVYRVCSVGDPKSGVVRIPITENADGSETPGVPEVFGGPSYVNKVWGDPQTERVLLLSPFPTYKLWVFDGKVSRWVGRVELGPYPNGLVFDDKAGRLYAYMPDTPDYNTQGGVKIVDIRPTPVPQTLLFPQFASPSSGRDEVGFLPSAPGVPSRILIRVRGGNMKKYPNWETVKFENEMFYRVLADEVPISEPADLSELDLLTIPVPEAPGKTEVSFDAEGSSYGIRLRSVGGIESALRPAGEHLHNVLVKYLVPACVFPDRELMAGWVPQARLSDLDALARSSGLEVDSNSKTDLTGPFSRCNPSAEASNFPASMKVVFDQLWPLWQMVQAQGNKTASSGVAAETGKDADGQCGELKQPTPAGEVVVSDCTQTPAGIVSRGQDVQGRPTVGFDSTTSKWDSYFKEVECVGDALATNQATVGNIYGSAKCVQRQGLVEANARGSATGSGPLAEEASSRGFSVAEGYSAVTIKRDLEKGVVVTSTAVARGIQLPGASFGASNFASLSIDRVETKAVAWSNGRPSDDPLVNPQATFTRTICGVHTPDGSIPGCLTAAQQQTMVDNWNKGWGGRSKMFLPTPDPNYYRGSPGGYIAGVIKPVADEVEDFLFAKDSQKEVSGLEITFYKDSESQGNARQTLQLAAVRAVAGLGVQCNPDYFYSSQKNDCVPIPDDILEEEFFEEDEEEEFFEDEEELDGEWTEVEAIGLGESLGSKIGKLLDRLPVLRQLPIRQMGEALLAASVWVLLGLPLLFAWRRLSLTNP